MKKSLIKHILLALGGVAFLIAVWVTAYFCVGNKLLVPSFLDTVKQTGLLLVNGGFWRAFAGTVLRVVFAFVLSLTVAVGFAVLSYLYPAFRAFIAPVVAVFRSLPVLAVLLIFLIWFQAGFAPVLVAFLSLFPVLYTATFSVLAGVDSAWIEMSKAYRVPRSVQIQKLYMPALFPRLVRESGGALGFGVKLVVSAEVLARTKDSLGVWMQDAKLYEQLPTLFALVLVACALGFVLETVCALFAKRLQRGRK